MFPSFSIAYEIIFIVFYLVFIQKNDKSFFIVKTYFSFSPNKGLDGGAHHAGEQEGVFYTLKTVDTRNSQINIRQNKYNS